VPEFLQYLKDNGVRMCVATATERYMVEIVLKRTGIYEFFEGILTCGEVGAGKNVPLIFDKALELMGTEKENSIIFEDAPHAIKTGKAAGYKVAAVADDSYVEENALIQSMCDVYVTSYPELIKNKFDI
jgi:HAD superfamily hydrolase (TIGR01509 family)